MTACQGRAVKRRRGETDQAFEARRIAGLLMRLERHSRSDGDCVVWAGLRNAKGYGRISNGKGRPDLLAHRIAWIARHGEPPPETPYVLHRCDNPPCFKDEHLFLGTKADNNADMAAKGRARNKFMDATECIHGHPFSEANTYVTPRGARGCRTCRRASVASYQARRKAA